MVFAVSYRYFQLLPFYLYLDSRLDLYFEHCLLRIFFWGFQQHCTLARLPSMLFNEDLLLFAFGPFHVIFVHASDCFYEYFHNRKHFTLRLTKRY